jgi:hypothetical protein
MITPAYRILQYRAFPCMLCLCCNRVSYNLNDVKHHYCGNCHVFLDDVPMHAEFRQTEGTRPSLTLHDPEPQEGTR